MSPELTVIFYAVAIVCFLAAAWGVSTLRRPIALGWLGAALFAVVPLVEALEAL